MVWQIKYLVIPWVTTRINLLHVDQRFILVHEVIIGLAYLWLVVQLAFQ
jgi:hypothetical protein